MLGSLNTNSAAAVGLQALGATRTSLQGVQDRLSTGLRIASAKDNGAVWAVASTQRVQGRALDAVKDSLNTARSVLDVTLSAGAQLTDLLRQMRQKALAASDAGVTDNTRLQYEAEYDKLSATYSNVVASASFNGVNLIDEGSGGLSALGSADGRVRVGSAHIQLNAAALFGGQDLIAVTFDPDPGNQAQQAQQAQQVQDPDAVQTQWMDPIIRPIRPHPIPLSTWADGTGATAATAMSWMDDALSAVTAAMSDFGVDAKAMDNQLSLVSRLQDGLTAGVGNLVDADLSRESARLTALQTRQALGVQALSVANASSKMLLNLFRSSSGP